MREPVFSAECQEPDGPIIRHAYFAPLSTDRLRVYWEKLSRFPTLFNRYIQDFDDFVSSFLSTEGGQITANGLVWEVDDVGLLFLTDIYPLFQATGHFTFWDQRFRGREPLVREALRYAFEHYGFRRIAAEVPLYSPATLSAVERVGFIKEGRLREYVYYQGKWFDVNLYSVLAKEILQNGIHEAEDQGEAAEVTSNATG